MTPIQTGKKINEKIVYSNLKDNREVRKPKFKLGQLVRIADIKRVFSKGDSTNYSCFYIQQQKLYKTLFLAIELFIYLRVIIKIFYYLLNYLLNK